MAVGRPRASRASTSMLPTKRSRGTPYLSSRSRPKLGSVTSCEAYAASVYRAEEGCDIV